jgi:hypothetical protein
MPDGLLLFTACALTVAFIRFAVWLIPEVDIRLFRATVHHFWFGVFFVALSFPLSSANHTLGILVLGLGLGLAADELVFMARGAGRDRQYWAIPSVVGSIALLMLMFYFRTTLAGVLY